MKLFCMATNFFILAIPFRIQLNGKRYPIQSKSKKICNIRPDWTPINRILYTTGVYQRWKKICLEFAEADSACFFCGGGVQEPCLLAEGRAKEEIDFFLIFIAKAYSLLFSNFLEKFCGVISNMRFADTALLSFTMFKGVFFHVCKLQNLTLFGCLIQASHAGLLVSSTHLRPFYNTCGFAICLKARLSVGYRWTMRSFVPLWGAL